MYQSITPIIALVLYSSLVPALLLVDLVVDLHVQAADLLHDVMYV